VGVGAGRPRRGADDQCGLRLGAGRRARQTRAARPPR
jgi:hypothetical protein